MKKVSGDDELLGLGEFKEVADAIEISLIITSGDRKAVCLKGCSFAEMHISKN